MKPPVFSCLASHTTDNGSLYGRFLFGPLPGDISLTLATILRRSLLHKKAPFVIVSAEIEGATHEYAALPGVQESVLEILLNLGEIVLTSKKANLLNSTYRSLNPSQQTSKNEAYVASLKISGPCRVTAKDFYWPDGIYCVKPNAYVATLSSNNTLGIRIKILSTLTPQAETFEKPDFRLFSKHLRSILALRFAASSKFRDNVCIGLGQGIKRNYVKQVLKTGRSDTITKNTTQDSFLGTTTRSFSPTVKGRSRIPKPLIKKSSIYSSVNKSPALGAKVENQFPLVSSAQLNHYPFLNFNLKTVTSRTNESKVSGLEIENSFKGMNKEKDSVLGGTISKDTLNSRKEPVSSLFAKQQNGTFSLPSTLQFLSNSLKKQAIKNLSFSQLFESPFPRIKKSKEEPISTKPWGYELAVTSSFYPVEKVNFVIERDDQLVGYRHRILFEVWTNGSLSPRQAIFNSINWIMKLLYSFREPTAPFEQNL